MSERSADPDYIAEGEFGQSVRVRQSVWYGRHLVELLPVGEANKSGGQVLLTPERAVDLIAVLSRVVADAKAGITYTPESRGDA